jgi:putative flippase GtrA
MRVVDEAAPSAPPMEPAAEARPATSANVSVSPGQVVVYYLFSACAMALDFGGLTLLVRAGLAAPVAAGISFLAGSTFHFSANRWLNFRAFHRTPATQARTYFAIVAVAWVITVATIYIIHDALGHSVLVAKIVATVITLPMGFLGHRFLTFNAGLRVAVRNLATRMRRTG